MLIPGLMLLFQDFNERSRRTWYSFMQCGLRPECIVLKDDAFLPEGVYSVFECFSDYCEPSENKALTPMDTNRFPLEKLWSLKRNGRKCEIYDGDVMKGTLALKDHCGHRCVEYAEWTDQEGKKLCRDHYDRSGRLYARTCFSPDGSVFSTDYYNLSGETVLTAYPASEIFLVHDPRGDRMLNSPAELAAEFLRRNHLENRTFLINSLHHPFSALRLIRKNAGGDILFFQEKITDTLPGRLQSILDRKDAFISTIYSDRHDALDRISAAVKDSALTTDYKGYVYPFTDTHPADLPVCCTGFLIVTDSDQIEGLDMLASAFPENTFTIAAKTSMSQRLLDFRKYPNIQLIPSCSSEKLLNLYGKGQIYLDINHGREVSDALYYAFCRDMLILSLRDTMHNALLLSDEAVFPDSASLCEGIRSLLSQKEKQARLLEKQKAAACSVNADSFVKGFVR